MPRGNRPPPSVCCPALRPRARAPMSAAESMDAPWAPRISGETRCPGAMDTTSGHIKDHENGQRPGAARVKSGSLHKRNVTDAYSDLYDWFRSGSACGANPGLPLRPRFAAASSVCILSQRSPFCLRSCRRCLTPPTPRPVVKSFFSQAWHSSTVRAG